MSLKCVVNNIGRYSNQQKAVRNFQKREQLRAKIAKYVLLCLLLTLVAAEIKEIVVQLKGHRTMVIALEAKAAVQETPEGKAQDLSRLGEQSPADGIAAEVRAVFGEQAENALKVMDCESKGDPTRIGDKHMKYWSYGLFQINQTWHKYPVETLLNPSENIKIAKEIYDRGGWGRWSCAKIIGII